MSDGGHYRCYERKKFSAERLGEIERANAIIREYEGRGFSLTLRQLYYQLVARGHVPNEKGQYDRLGGLIRDGRLAGLVSWTAIEDRGRTLMGLETCSGPSEALVRAADGYRRDLWQDQPVRPEVWVEKQALESVVGEMCNKLRVDFFAQRGYSSSSATWRAGQRMARYVRAGQRPIVFHIGDHDPSGIDMTRDNAERLSMFAGVPIQVVRLALNWEQIQALHPPPNPAKMTDSRAAVYVSRFGYESWEVDALEPTTIMDIIEKAVDAVRDERLWSTALAREVAEREFIREVGGGTDE